MRSVFIKVGLVDPPAAGLSDPLDDSSFLFNVDLSDLLDTWEIGVRTLFPDRYLIALAQA